MNPAYVLQAILDNKGITHIKLAKELDIKSQVVDERCKGDRYMRVDTLINTYAAVGYKVVAMPADGDGPSYELSL